MSGKPIVATVPPSFTVRLAAMGNGAKPPGHVSKGTTRRNNFRTTALT